MALFNTFGVNRWLKFEVLRKSDGAGANDRDDRPRVTAGVMPPVLHLDRPLLQHLQTNIQAPRMWIHKAVSLVAHIVMTPTESLHR
jgi:hypothetical protein